MSREESEKLTKVLEGIKEIFSDYTEEKWYKSLEQTIYELKHPE